MTGTWSKGTSINDVTALGGRVSRIFLQKTKKALTRDDGGGGVKNYQELRKVFMDAP